MSGPALSTACRRNDCLRCRTADCLHRCHAAAVDDAGHVYDAVIPTLQGAGYGPGLVPAPVLVDPGARPARGTDQWRHARDVSAELGPWVPGGITPADAGGWVSMPWQLRVRALRAIRGWVDAELQRTAGEALDGGASWSELGRALGVTRQAAAQKYGPAAGVESAAGR